MKGMQGIQGNAGEFKGRWGNEEKIQGKKGYVHKWGWNKTEINLVLW